MLIWCSIYMRFDLYSWYIMVDTDWNQGTALSVCRVQIDGGGIEPLTSTFHPLYFTWNMEPYWYHLDNSSTECNFWFHSYAISMWSYIYYTLQTSQNQQKFRQNQKISKLKQLSVFVHYVIQVLVFIGKLLITKFTFEIFCQAMLIGHVTSEARLGRCAFSTNLTMKWILLVVDDLNMCIETATTCKCDHAFSAFMLNFSSFCCYRILEDKKPVYVLDKIPDNNIQIQIKFCDFMYSECLYHGCWFYSGFNYCITYLKSAESSYLSPNNLTLKT